MRIEFRADNLYLPRSVIIFAASDNSIAAPLISFFIWSFIFFICFILGSDEKYYLEYFFIFLSTCIFFYPKFWNFLLVIRVIVSLIYQNKKSCSVVIENKEENIYQFVDGYFHRTIPIHNASFLRYKNYVVLKRESSVILIPCLLFDRLEIKLESNDFPELDFGWCGKVYEMIIINLMEPVNKTV